MFKQPNHWNLLSSEDQKIYREIYEAVTSPSNKCKRNTRVDDFQEILDAIDIFENISDDDKWKRCLVCGIFKVNNCIAVNISQLKHLINKCKSSINGSLRRLGFGNIIKKVDGCEQIFEVIPYLENHPSELRRWTIRYNSNKNVDNELFNFDQLKTEDTELQEFENVDSENSEKMTEPEVALDYTYNQNDINNGIDLFADTSVPSIYDDQVSNWTISSENEIEFDFSFDN
ncbi:hypothetical protein TRFO_38346 [Tritrichomonas foetus]|uniref:Initiator binding domain-containing protein n=1 Tax=Tritrichomonas foetus TaxID=1144522 RepID=A0A1J4JCY8_9EUKA|nr:hypothetical protein TRFO_38346 [Tritrichomonas foetus]|eukprot:OHS95531.1 hypothetical protein TRFO_38346 [Tritrichomonas foetus]